MKKAAGRKRRKNLNRVRRKAKVARAKRRTAGSLRKSVRNKQRIRLAKIRRGKIKS